MKPCSRFIHIWRSAGLNQLCTPVYLLRFTAMASGSALRPVLTQAKEAVDAASKTTRQPQTTNGGNDGKRDVGTSNSKRGLETTAPVNGGTKADVNQRRSKRIET